MAQTLSRGFNKPQFMDSDGCGAVWRDTADIKLVAQLAAASTVEFPLPAGADVSMLEFQLSDLDTGAAMLFSVGYAPRDPASTLAAVPAYFAAAGQNTGQAGGRLRCAFEPIYFAEPVKVVLTIGTAPAGLPAAGKVTMIAVGNCVGVP